MNQAVLLLFNFLCVAPLYVFVILIITLHFHNYYQSLCCSPCNVRLLRSRDKKCFVFLPRFSSYGALSKIAIVNDACTMLNKILNAEVSDTTKAHSSNAVKYIFIFVIFGIHHINFIIQNIPNSH